MPWLINAAQLEKFRKNQKNVIVLDASWHLPEKERHAKNEFHQQHIAGAKFLDLNNFYDNNSELPNMLLRDENVIAEKIGALGITKEIKIIFYDQSELHTSCRALWMFKVFGHPTNQLYILDGGLAAWERFGGKMEGGESKISSHKPYTVSFQAAYIRTLAQMKANLHHPQEQVVDVRHAVRYAGGPEHRQEMRLGHIPGSFSFPYMTMFESDGTFKPMEKILKQLSSVGVDLTTPIITTCGSGVTSAILNFVLDVSDRTNNSLYDGSWSEWGSTQLFNGEHDISDRPVVTSLDN